MKITLDELFRGIFLLELNQFNESDFIEPEKEVEPKKRILGPMDELEKRLFTLIHKLEAEASQLASKRDKISSKRRITSLPSKEEDMLQDEIHRIEQKVEVLHCIMLISARGRFTITPNQAIFFRKGFSVAEWC